LLAGGFFESSLLAVGFFEGSFGGLPFGRESHPVINP
jgi:hypothetical protein